MEVNNYIFFLIISQILFLFGLFYFNYKFINISSNKVFRYYSSFILSLIFLSCLIGYSYFFFKVNHKFILTFIIFFILFGFYILSKKIYFVFSGLDLKYFFLKKNNLNLYIIIILILFFLLSISPPTDIDSIDYHIGAPLIWFEHQSFIPRSDWLHYRLTGLGEYINIIGIYLKTYNFGQIIQFFSLVLVLIAGCNYINNKVNKKFFIITILSCPLLLFLVSTQKYQLAGSAIIFCSIIFLTHKSKLSDFEIIIILCSIFFALGSKFSYLIQSGLIWFYLLYKCYYLKKVTKLFLYSIIIFFVVLFFPLYLKNFIFYGDPLSPILEGFKINKDYNILNFINYNKTFAIDFNNYEFIFYSFFPKSFGEITTILGLAPLLIFFIQFKKTDKNSKVILIFAILGTLIVFFFV